MSREKNVLRKKLQNKKKRTKAIFIGLIAAAVVIVIAAFILIVSLVNKPKAEAAVLDFLGQYKAQNYQAVADMLTLSVSELNHSETEISDVFIDAITDINYSLVKSSAFMGSAKVTVDVDNIFVPDVFELYFTEAMFLQGEEESAGEGDNGDAVTEQTDGEGVNDAANKLFDELVTEYKNTMRLTEAITFEVKKTKGRWMIVPDSYLVNALIGYQYYQASSYGE